LPLSRRRPVNPPVSEKVSWLESKFATWNTGFVIAEPKVIVTVARPEEKSLEYPTWSVSGIEGV